VLLSAGARPRLLVEALLEADPRLLERDQLGAEDLQGHQTIELGIVGLVHDAAPGAAGLPTKRVAAAVARGTLRPPRPSRLGSWPLYPTPLVPRPSSERSS